LAIDETPRKLAEVDANSKKTTRQALTMPAGGLELRCWWRFNGQFRARAIDNQPARPSSRDAMPSPHALISPNKKATPHLAKSLFSFVRNDYFAAAKFSPTLVQFTTDQNAAM
jgi:hypothetical protein